MLRHRVLGAITAIALVVGGCSLEDAVRVNPKVGLIDPEIIRTPDGARQLYNGGVLEFADAIGGSFLTSLFAAAAVRTDEMMVGTASMVGFDERTGANPSNPTPPYLFIYQAVHRPRVLASQGRQALAAYAPSMPTAWQSHLASIEAYSILWFAEMFCSGVPLTDVPLDGGSREGRAYTTNELFERAIALFDTAITLAGDSIRFGHFARVGKARALLGLGRHSDAAMAVAAVPTDFVFVAAFNTAAGTSNPFGSNPRAGQVVDGEGGAGLTWSSDSRTATTTTPGQSGAMRISAKYSVVGGVFTPTASVRDNPMRVADGLEARLIEAEADLHAGGSAWLTTLNTLRRTCIGTAACAPVPGLDTTSNVNYQPNLTDPGTTAGRVDLLMRERAMWLYLTGHRMGDLRRLVRVYERDPNTVWPSGTYTNPGFPGFVNPPPTNGSDYGTHTVFAVQGEEGNNNYTGCINLDP